MPFLPNPKTAKNGFFKNILTNLSHSWEKTQKNTKKKSVQNSEKPGFFLIFLKISQNSWLFRQIFDRLFFENGQKGPVFVRVWLTPTFFVLKSVLITPFSKTCFLCFSKVKSCARCAKKHQKNTQKSRFLKTPKNTKKWHFSKKGVFCQKTPLF